MLDTSSERQFSFAAHRARLAPGAEAHRSAASSRSAAMIRRSELGEI